MKKEFKEYELSEDLLKAIEMLNYKNPTKVQEQVIPAILEKKDVIVKSQTGSGKTAAFAIPLCQLIDWDENKPSVLVITPTRELAIQVKEDIFNIGRFKRVKVSAIYGKAPFSIQTKELKQKTHFVVGTPGRIIYHIVRRTFDRSNIKYLVIDEADEILHMGFIEQIKTIISSIPTEHITMLFSATMPEDIKRLAVRYMNKPIQINSEEETRSLDRIEQERYSVSDSEKSKLLRDLTIIENPDSCMIFCNTKQKVDEVFDELTKLRYTVQKIHGGMEQIERIEVMDKFKHGHFRYLVATDVAARGIDVDSITLVINYDIPQDKDNYVHRVGRTGRVDKKGKAITFVNQYESRFLNDIHYLIEKEIPLKKRPTQETVSDSKQNFVQKQNTKPETKYSKGTGLNKEIMKLHINAGKKTKMRTVDIVGTLCNIEGVMPEDIGIINVGDISTFVEILNNKGELVYKVLQSTPIKGRPRRVSKAD